MGMLFVTYFRLMQKEDRRQLTAGFLFRVFCLYIRFNMALRDNLIPAAGSAGCAVRFVYDTTVCSQNPEKTGAPPEGEAP